MVRPHISHEAAIKTAIYLSPFVKLSVMANLLPLETGLRTLLHFALRLIRQINNTYKKK